MLDWCKTLTYLQKPKVVLKAPKLWRRSIKGKNSITSALYAIKNLCEREGLAQLNVSGLRWILIYKWCRINDIFVKFIKVQDIMSHWSNSHPVEIYLESILEAAYVNMILWFKGISEIKEVANCHRLSMNQNCLDPRTICRRNQVFSIASVCGCK
jgi:hypothetical protein